MHIRMWFATIMQATLSCFWQISFVTDFVNMSGYKKLRIKSLLLKGDKPINTIIYGFYLILN